MPDSRNRQSAREASVKMAFCGMMAALSLVFMLTGGVIPIATFAAPLFSGLLLLPVRVEFGRRAAWMTWLAAAALSILLGLDKEAAAFYFFVGWYPIIKWDLDQRVRGKTARLLIKAAIFTAAVGAMYAVLLLIFGVETILLEFREMGLWMSLLFAAMMIASLLIYDRLINPLLILYGQRLRPKLKSFLHTK
ncbi:MAG: hypothetical protein IKP40_08130 [Clostridia bacterium]|nr:hypothetical protein [Clostridia bacterium]